MRGLRIGVAELAAEALEERADAELLDDLVALRQLLTRLEAEWLRRVAEVDARRAFRMEGAVSTAAWLRHRSGESSAVAARWVRAARSLCHMPVTTEGFRDGGLARSRVDVLARAQRRCPELFARDESVLVKAAVDLG